MKTFELSVDVIPKIAKEIKKAEKFIRIAIFQLHNENIFSVLNDKLQEDVTIEIFTLPYDSINEDVKDEVTARFESLKRKGAKLYFCRWNVGDPERTTTAVGRWYSFHGKFLVTDKSAIALSANFIQTKELDAILIYRNESNKIADYNKKFNELINLFITENKGYEGTVRQRIIETGIKNVRELFQLPRVIESNIHKNHWIRHYPATICPTITTAEDKLYIAPFDCRARDFLQTIISLAAKFVYVSTESFTDEEFALDLKKTKLKGLDIKILCGATSMDFPDRIQQMLRELLAYQIGIQAVEEDLHAKLIVTDKHVVISSVNLNKINLGFNMTQKFWRANTETIAVCSDKQVINDAKAQYLSIYNQGVNIEEKLAEKIKTIVTDVLTKTFGLRTSGEVKSLFAKVIIKKEIECKKFVLSVGEITKNLINFLRKRVVEKEDFLMALTLYFLSESKLNHNQLKEKLSILDVPFDFRLILNKLLNNKLIEKTDDFYKIKINTLFTNRK
ncbi:MAG: phospholipase D-like domain-containing protein [candidate division WOR-3 bacterium]|nr:phospholipase D-like domain-containing protein [candidate division WOR-3 bacterium]MDH5684292.1 phospholipase D-like domain-containing protein [candidate division WOR-3 bacterium]